MSAGLPPHGPKPRRRLRRTEREERNWRRRRADRLLETLAWHATVVGRHVEVVIKRGP